MATMAVLGKGAQKKQQKFDRLVWCDTQAIDFVAASFVQAGECTYIHSRCGWPGQKTHKYTGMQWYAYYIKT